MAFAFQTHLDLVESDEAELARQALVRARRAHWEEPAGALAVAVRCYEIARSLEDATLCARARALQGAVSLHRGDLGGALELLVAAERYCERSNDAAAGAEVAALKAQLSFFTGSYTEALSHAELSVRLADDAKDRDLRMYARRTTCLVFGNVGIGDWGERLG